VIVRSKDYKTAFLMGAGASRGAIGHVILNRKRLKPPLNGDFFQVADTYARAKGAGSADGKRLRRLRRVFKTDLPTKGMPTMEEAFSLLYIAKDFPGIYGTGPGRKPRAGERQEIEDFLRLAFGIFAALDQESEKGTAYDRLAKMLSPGDTIITLNYDTLMDSALVRRGWDPAVGYCLTGGKRKVQWAPQRKPPDANMAKVSLLKLHGSVNWYVRGSFGNLARVFDRKPSKVSAPRKNEMKGHIRQIIPPIYGKFFGHAQWQQLWTKAHGALLDADILVVIGCSLIDTDFHLRALLSRIGKSRKQHGQLFKRVFLVDRVTVRRKWAKALKGCFRACSDSSTFERFLRKELKT